MEFIDEDSRVARATLLLHVLPSDGLGGGDIQATLTWNSEADLDLHGIEPSGDEIYYGSPGPTDTDGELDHDANAGCGTVDPSPTENIHWPSADAQTGQYQFAVVTYDDCGTSDLNWHLVVRVRGAIVVDQTGYSDSDWYQVDYNAANGSTRVRRVPLAKRPAAPGPRK